MKTILIGCLLTISLIFKDSFLFSQKKYYKELPLLEIKNKQMDSIISNTICRLKKCNNYTKAIVFNIINVKKNDSLFIDIMAVHDQKTALTDRYWKPYGYFSFNNHLFFIFCDSLPDIFKETKEKKIFTINDTPDILLVADYTEWLFFYGRNKFYLRKVINECKNTGN